jgi:branched-subunit amino acid ABC-type transport system permease component
VTVRAARTVGAGLVFLYVLHLYVNLSPGDVVQGIALGSLYGIIGVGIILIYRTKRIINFSAGAIGAVPAILALLLDVQHHVPYLVVLPSSTSASCAASRRRPG